MGQPLYSDTEGIFGRENSSVIYVPSFDGSTLRRHMFLLCLLALSRASLHLLAIFPMTYIFFSSILPANSLSLAWTLPAPFAKGTTGAWSILLMVRVAVDLGLKNRVVYLHRRIKEQRKRDARLNDILKHSTEYKNNLMIFDLSE